MTFPTGGNWPNWQRAYRYGALVIQPPPELASALDTVRERLDPTSAATIGAHITLTPPFAAAPSSADQERVGTTIRRLASMTLQLDRPKQFSGSSVIYLPVIGETGALQNLRQRLLETGLFRLDLPHTADFVPHLTLSEFATAPQALPADVPQPEGMAFLVTAVSWVVPDEAFHFTVRRTFLLGPAMS